MEIFELRYFLAVARFENIHRASEQGHVSPAALSKAVTRLEDELGVRLFSREGRRIRLTPHGRELQRRASELVRLEEDTRLTLAGHPGTLQVTITAPEILLARFGPEVGRSIRAAHPLAAFELIAADDADCLDQVARGDAQLAIVTADVPRALGLTEKKLAETRFQTFVGRGHPLHARARAGKAVPVRELLGHEFVSPTHPLLGRVGARQSPDGWRDDEFPRRIGFRTSSLRTLEELAASGQAVASLPDSLGTALGLQVVRVTGCPYTCEQTVRLVARRPRDTSWLARLF